MRRAGAETSRTVLDLVEQHMLQSGARSARVRLAASTAVVQNGCNDRRSAAEREQWSCVHPRRYAPCMTARLVGQMSDENATPVRHSKSCRP
jgi:hypothetical protein